MNGLLDLLPGRVEVALLVLCRVSACVMVMPALGEAELPMMVRAGVAIALTTLIAPLAWPHFATLPPVEAMSVGDLLAAIACELLAGGLIGWLARLVTTALPIAGQMIATLIGLASVLQPDPSLGASSTALARALSLSAPVLLFASHLYLLPIQAIAGSYALIPPGSGWFSGHAPMATDAATAVLHATSQAFALALRLAAPSLLISLLWQLFFGVLARLLPAMQVLGLSGSAEIPVGLLVLVLLLPSLLMLWEHAAGHVFQTLPGL